MGKRSNEFKIVEVLDKESTQTLSEAIKANTWWFEDVLFNNCYTTPEECDIIRKHTKNQVIDGECND